MMDEGSWAAIRAHDAAGRVPAGSRRDALHARSIPGCAGSRSAAMPLRVSLEPAIILPCLWIPKSEFLRGYPLAQLVRELDDFPEALRDAGGWAKLLRGV